MKCAFAMLAVLVLCVPPAAADWLQEGFDAARTGRIDGAGPAWDDVALRIHLPLPAVPSNAQTQPLIIDGVAYVLVSGYEDNSGDSDSSVYAVGLQNGTVWPVWHESLSSEGTLEHNAAVSGMSSDGRRLFLQSNVRLVAHPLDGSEGWNRTMGVHPEDAPVDRSREHALRSECHPHPAVHDGTVYVACTHWTPAGHTAMMAYNASTGVDAWLLPWVREADPVVRPEAAENHLPSYAVNTAHPTHFSLTRLPGLSVVGPYVFLTVIDALRPGVSLSGGDYRAVYAVSADAGESQLAQAWEWMPLDLASGLATPQSRLVPPAVTGNATRFYVEGQDLNYYDAALTAFVERPFRDPVENDPGSGLAFDDGELYVTAQGILYKYAAALNEIWRFDLGGTWAAGTPAVGDTTVFILAQTADSHALYAIDSFTGDLRWIHQFDAEVALAFDGDMAVAVDAKGVVTILGTTPASIVARARAVDAYPAPGELVRVDLSPSQPGQDGAPTTFCADWGDATREECGPSPLMEHRYTLPVDAVATFTASNAAGQSASLPMTFHVGQMDPSITMWNSPFHREFQETSFFLLGLLVTAIVALIGIYRAGRKRRTLQAELRRLEAEYKQTRGDADACERMLAERRARARSLFLEKRLEEAHSSFLEKRIDELQRGLRAGAVDEELRFLSHGLVLRLKRLLADARVDGVERADFLDALERERLPAKQRDKVRGLLESWFMRDEEARA